MSSILPQLCAIVYIFCAQNSKVGENFSNSSLEKNYKKIYSPIARGHIDLNARKKALQYGLKNSPALKMWKARLERAKAILKGANIFPNNPELSIEGGVRIPPAEGNKAPPPTPQGGVELSLAFPIGGRWGRKIRWAKAQLARVHREWKTAIFRYKIRFHRAWTDASTSALLWQKRREITQFFLRLERLTQKRLKYGTATKLDLQLIQTSRQQSQLATAESFIQFQKFKTDLKILLGLPVDKRGFPWKIGVLPQLPPPPPLNRLLKEQETAHPQLLAARAAIEQTKAALALARSESVPDLTLALRYSYEEREHVLMGALSIPIPLFWRNQGDIGAQRAELQRAELFYSQLQYRLREQLRSDLNIYKNSLQMLKIIRQRLKTVRQLAEMSEKGLAQGTFSLFQVVTAHRRILQNRILYVQTLSNAHKNYLSLCLTAGISPKYRK